MSFASTTVDVPNVDHLFFSQIDFIPLPLMISLCIISNNARYADLLACKYTDQDQKQMGISITLPLKVQKQVGLIR